MGNVQDSWQVLQHWQADVTGQSETAVIAALSFWDYSLVANVQGSDTYKATGRCFSVAAGRISYSYGLKGIFPHLCILQSANILLSRERMVLSTVSAW